MLRLGCGPSRGWSTCLVVPTAANRLVRGVASSAVSSVTAKKVGTEEEEEDDAVEMANALRAARARLVAGAAATSVLDHGDADVMAAGQAEDVAFASARTPEDDAALAGALLRRQVERTTLAAALDREPGIALLAPNNFTGVAGVGPASKVASDRGDLEALDSVLTKALKRHTIAALVAAKPHHLNPASPSALVSKIRYLVNRFGGPGPHTSDGAAAARTASHGDVQAAMRLARTHSAGHAPWMELSQAVMVARLDAYLAWGCSINDIAKSKLLNYDPWGEAVTTMQGFGVNVAMVAKRFPSVLALSRGRMDEAIASFEAVGLSSPVVLKTVFEKSGLIFTREVGDVRARLAYLRDEGCDLRRVLLRGPSILQITEETLARRMRLIREDFGVEDVAKAVTASPNMLAITDDLLRSKVRFLVEELGIADLGSVLTRAPNILSLSVDNNMRPKTEMMRAAGIQDLTKLLSQQPSLLYVSPHSMQEKISFLTDVMGRDVAEIERYCVYLSLSLEKRIKPRYEAAVRSGLGDAGLGLLFRTSDAEFARRCQQARRKKDALARATDAAENSG